MPNGIAALVLAGVALYFFGATFYVWAKMELSPRFMAFVCVGWWNLSFYCCVGNSGLDMRYA
jgi:hypothetical protein